MATVGWATGETGPRASPHPADLLTWDWDQTSLPSYWVGHSKSQGELRFQAQGRSCRLTLQMGMDVGRGEKLALFLHQSNTHTGNQSGKPSSQHLTGSKSLSVVGLWGFEGEGGFISQTGEVSERSSWQWGAMQGARQAVVSSFTLEHLACLSPDLW